MARKKYYDNFWDWALPRLNFLLLLWIFLRGNSTNLETWHALKQVIYSLIEQIIWWL